MPRVPGWPLFFAFVQKNTPSEAAKKCCARFGRFVDGFVFPIAGNKLTPPGARLRKCLLSIPES
jgi:hypothetical protein